MNSIAVCLPLSTGPSNWSLLSWHLIALEPGCVSRHKFPRHSSGAEQPLLTEKPWQLLLEEPGSCQPSPQARRRDWAVSHAMSTGVMVVDRDLFSLVFPPSASLPQTKEKLEIQNGFLLPAASACIPQAPLKGPPTQHRSCCN